MQLSALNYANGVEKVSFVGIMLAILVATAAFWGVTLMVHTVVTSEFLVFCTRTMTSVC